MRVSIPLLVIAFVLAATLAPAAAESQMTFGLNSGARVRVRVRSSVFGEGRQARRTAHIVAQAADSMTFRLEGRQETVTLRRSDVLGMEG